MKKQLSKVMSKAWELARKASNKFGNKVSEYIGESMKIAWAIVRSERGSLRFSLQAQSNNNQNRKSWVKKFFVEDAEIVSDFVESLSDYEDEYKEYDLADGYYLICDLGTYEYVKIENGKKEEIEYLDIQKSLSDDLYVEVSEGSRNHKSYIAEIVGEHERWGMDREFVSKNSEQYRIKYAFLKEGKVYEIQDAGERRYVVIEGAQSVEIEKEDVLKIVQKKKEEKEQEKVEKVLPYLKELQQLIEEAKGKEVSLEQGIQASLSRMENHSVEREIELIQSFIEKGKKQK